MINVFIGSDSPCAARSNGTRQTRLVTHADVIAAVPLRIRKRRAEILARTSGHFTVFAGVPRILDRALKIIGIQRKTAKAAAPQLMFVLHAFGNVYRVDHAVAFFNNLLPVASDAAFEHADFVLHARTQMRIFRRTRRVAGAGTFLIHTHASAVAAVRSAAFGAHIARAELA